MTATSSDFLLDGNVRILVPLHPSREDLFLAKSLAEDFDDRFAVHLKIERVSRLDPRERIILIGSSQNPLVHEYCARQHLTVNANTPGAEGYILHADTNLVVIAGSDDRGAFYGLQSLRQLALRDKNHLLISGVQISDWPDKPFRGIKLYLPGRSNLAFFKRFVRDFMALYKYNTLIMEMNANMRLDSHPEVNSGWLALIKDTNYSRRNYPPGSFHNIQQNSSHQDTADGDILEKEEVADLARWVRRYHIELIPELPSLTHSYYLLANHRELAAVPQNQWPDTYCPSNRETYKLLFDIYDEYIDLLRPAMVHVGHDELFTPLAVSPSCEDQNIGELYGEDIKKIHDHLAAKGIKMAMWGDMLLESVRGKGAQKSTAPDGLTYYTPGGMTGDQVRRLIPTDILVFNWFWDEYAPGITSRDVSHEEELDKMGFKEIYGNMNSELANYDTRKNRSSVLGGAPSAWFATNEVGFGKDLMADFLGSISALWTGKMLPAKQLRTSIQAMIPEIRIRLSGITPPSATEASIVSANIAGSFNIGNTVPSLGVDLNGMGFGRESFGAVSFDLKSTDGKVAAFVLTEGEKKKDLPKEVASMAIGEDATSLIFLHASARTAFNRESYRVLWDQDDTADLLGWYEVVYQDGFVITIPVRYGVNIQAWNWSDGVSARDYCYKADPIVVGGSQEHPITFFAYEWMNPRLGKVIKEVRLKGTTGFRGGSSDYIDDYGPVIPDNGILLKAISVVKKRN